MKLLQSRLPEFSQITHRGAPFLTITGTDEKQIEAAKDAVDEFARANQSVCPRFVIGCRHRLTHSYLGFERQADGSDCWPIVGATTSEFRSWLGCTSRQLPGALLTCHYALGGSNESRMEAMGGKLVEFCSAGSPTPWNEIRPGFYVHDEVMNPDPYGRTSTCSRLIGGQVITQVIYKPWDQKP